MTSATLGLELKALDAMNNPSLWFASVTLVWELKVYMLLIA